MAVFGTCERQAGPGLATLGAFEGQVGPGSVIWDRIDGPAGFGRAVSGAVEHQVGRGPAIFGAFEHQVGPGLAVRDETAMWSTRQAGYNGIFSFPALFFQPGDPHNNTYFTYRKQLFHFWHFCISGPAVWDTTDGPAGPGTTDSSAVERPVGPGPAVLGTFDHFERTQR